MLKRFFVRKYLALQEKHYRISAEMEKRSAAQCHANAHSFSIRAYQMRMRLEDLK